MDATPSFTLLNGNTVRILSAGDDTEGRLTVIDYVDHTQGNPPPFTRHDFIETFNVLEGRLAFQYQDEPFFLVTAGSTVTVADGRSHTFWNPDDKPLHLILACTPAGLDRFFEAIHNVMEKFRTGGVSKDEFDANMRRIRKEHQIEQTAPSPDIGSPSA